MQSLILTLHIIVCFLLVILILLQSGKEGMGVIFGGGNSSVFGSSGAGGILAKLTTLMAIIFVITSLSYTYVTSSRPTSESVILNVQIEEPIKTDSARSDPGKSEAVLPTPEPEQAKLSSNSVNEPTVNVKPAETDPASKPDAASKPAQ